MRTSFNQCLHSSGSVGKPLLSANVWFAFWRGCVSILVVFQMRYTSQCCLRCVFVPCLKAAGWEDWLLLWLKVSSRPRWESALAAIAAMEVWTKHTRKHALHISSMYSTNAFVHFCWTVASLFLLYHDNNKCAIIWCTVQRNIAECVKALRNVQTALECTLNCPVMSLGTAEKRITW